VTGQIVDIPVTDHQKKQKWNYIHSLPENILRSIRPIMDVGISYLKNPYLKMEILAADSIEKAGNAEIVYKSLPFYGDSVGFFRETVKKKLEPGIYLAKIYSLKHSEDEDDDDDEDGDDTPEKASEQVSDEKSVLGYGKLTVLPEDFKGMIVTSDIDQTFLNTPLDSIPGLIETLFETPRFRTPIPGMPAFYRAIQEGKNYPLYFLSASPHFYRRTLSVLFSMHGIDPSGLYLKSFAGTLDGIVKKIISSAMNLDKILEGGVKHAFDRSVKYLGSSMYNLVDQVSYKLVALLEHRLTQPTDAREILIGDNIDSDYFIFMLYQFLLISEIEGSSLHKYLYELRFLDREAFTSDSADRVGELVKKNHALHGRVNSVSAVWINSASEENKEDLLKKTLAKIPEDLSIGGKLVPFQIYENVLELLLIAIDTGLIDSSQFKKIWSELEGRTFKGITFSRQFAEESIRSFPFCNILSETLLKSWNSRT